MFDRSALVDSDPTPYQSYRSFIVLFYRAGISKEESRQRRNTTADDEEIGNHSEPSNHPTPMYFSIPTRSNSTESEGHTRSQGAHGTTLRWTPPGDTLHSRLRSHFPKTQLGLQNTRAWTRESRSRLLRSSCSRRSREIASGHYGRLLTASPPATTTLPCLLFYLAFSSFGSVRFSFLRHTEARTLTNLFQFPSYQFFFSLLSLPVVQARSSCGMRCAPVASTSSWSPLTTTCADPPTDYTLSSPRERSPTIERAR